MSRRRWIGWLGIAVAGVLVLAGVLAVAALLALPLPATREWLRSELEEVLSGALNDPVRIAAIPSLGPGWVSLEGVTIGGGEEPTARVEVVTIDVAIGRVFPPRVAIDVDLVGPELDLERDGSGRWNVERWAGTDEEPADDDDLGIPRWIARIGLAAHRARVDVAGLAPRTLRLSSLELAGRLWVGVLRDSVMEIEGLSAVLGGASQLGLHGTYELEGDGSVYGVLRLDPLVGADLGGLVAGLREEVRLRGTITADGAIESPAIELALHGGTARLAGRVELRPEAQGLSVEASLEAEDVDVAQILVDAPEGRLTGRVRVTASFAEDEIGALQARLDLRDSEILGVQAESLSAHAETEDGVVRFDVEAATPDAGVRVALQGEVRSDEPHRTTVGGEVVVHEGTGLSDEVRAYLAGSDLSARVSLLIADPLATAPTASLDVKLAPGRLRGLPLDGAELEVRLQPDLLSLDRLWIGARQTDLAGHAWMQLGAERSVGGQLRGPLSLALLSDAYGVVETDARFWGEVTDVAAVGVFGSLGPVEIPGLEGSFSARIDAAHLGGDGGEAKLELRGAFSPSDELASVFGRDERETVVDATWSRATQGDAGVDRLGLDVRLGKDEPGSAALRAELEATAGTARAEIEALRVRPMSGPSWRLDGATVVEVRSDGVEVGATRLRVGEGRIDAQGYVAGAAGRDNDLTIRVAGLDLAGLCELLVVGDRCGGAIDAGLSVTGPPSRPDVSLDLAVEDVAVSEQPYGRLSATARTRGGNLAVVASLDGGRAGSLRLDAELPLEVGGHAPTVSRTRDAAADLRLDDLQVDALRAFAGRAVRRLDGRASARVSLRGPLSNPRLDGDLRIDDLILAASATGVTYREGRLRLSIDPERFVLDELTLDGGRISAGGEVDLDGGLPRRFDLWAALDEAVVVRRSEADVTASGRATLAGPVHGSRLEGDFEIDEATLRPTFAPGGGVVEPDPSIVVVQRYEDAPPWVSGVPPDLGGERVATPERPDADPRAAAHAPDVYHDMSVNLTVRLGERVVVQRYDANLRLEGKIRLHKAPADEIRIAGGIGGRRGWYVFQGRRFEIESANVTFTGETPIDPTLDVAARYQTGDYTVWVRITGTAKHPSLDLSSEPPLDESDVLAVVLFGKPASQLDDSQGQVLQSQAFALLASYVAPDLQRSILDTFGLTSLTFSMPTGDTAGTIGVGRYFGDDLFISVARDFGGPTGGTNRQLQGLVGSSVTIQYSLTPSVTLQGASSTEGESSVDVIWHRRY